MKTFFFFFLETTWIWAKKTFEFPISAENSLSILVKTFFFFFFFFLGDHLNLGEKTFEFPSSAEKSLSILVKTSEFLRFCASNPPPTKIFWIRHCLCPPFRFIQDTFLEHLVTTRRQAIIEKGLIIFKHNSRSKFSRLYAQLLASNCFT